MALSNAVISYDVSDQVGTDFDIRRTKIWVSTNIADGTVIDTVGNAIRVDTGQGTLAADGTGSVTVWTPGTGSNPDSWQTYVHLDYASPMDRTRKRRTFGPFTVTTSANLADLVEEQEVPAEYLTTITAALDAYADSAAAASTSAAASATSAAASAAAAEVISDIATPDALVAALVGDDGSDTSAALAALYPRVFTPEAYGAVGDATVTNDAAAIQAAATAAAAEGGLFYAEGSYRINSTITVTSDADLSRATFNYYGAATALQLGSGVSGSGGLFYHKTVVTPTIINANKVGLGWTGSTLGIQVINGFGCDITVTRVEGFVTGYYAYGKGTGNVFNDVRFLHLDNNKRNLALGADATGWCNSNIHRLGSLSHNSGEGTNVSGVRQILLETATNLVNGNLFLGGSVEGNTAEYHLDCDGPYNRFEEVRWEVTGGARVIWRANGDRNVINCGYGAEALVETHVAGAGPNQVFTTSATRLSGTTAKAVLVLENVTSAAAGADAIMDPGAGAAGSDPATAYRVLRTANTTGMKRAIDAYPRLLLDHDNGWVKFHGDGTAAPVPYLRGIGGLGIALVAGNLYFAGDNALDIGVDSLRPRDLFLGRHAEIGGNLDHNGSAVGFYGTAPAAKPTVTGSRGGNAALASLLTSLAGLGLITDSSSA